MFAWPMRISTNEFKEKTSIESPYKKDNIY